MYHEVYVALKYHPLTNFAVASEAD